MSRHGRDAAIATDRSEQNRGAIADIGANSRARQFSAVLALSFLTAVALLMAVNVAASTAIPPGTWTQTFGEEFNGSSVNTSIWTKGWQTSAEISGPVSGRCFSSAFGSESEGSLHLEVRNQSSTCGGKEQKETGALVESNPADGVSGHAGFAYSYGYVEWRVYLPGVAETGCPAGGCIANWPALWSFPDDNTGTPEIDTMEGLENWENNKLVQKGVPCFHFHPWPEFGQSEHVCASGNYVGWHTFGSDWEPASVTYYYDGTKVGEIPTPKGNRSTPQYLIMNAAASYSLNPKLFNHAMLVDYVRVYQHLPIVTTGAATGKQPLQATLNGTVNPNGTALSNCHFDYGTSASYGSSAPCSGPESGETATVSFTPGTTYHFRIVATNASGTSYGNDETVTTPGPVEAVTHAATDLREMQATLNGTVNPRGYDAKYYFQYGTSTSYGSSTSEGDAGGGTSAVPGSATITTLQPGMTYHYRLIATSGGVTSYGADSVFTALSAPSMAVDKEGNRWVAVEGTNNTLDVYEALHSTNEWHGPVQIGGVGSTYSAPSLAIELADGQLVVVAEGPSHSMYSYTGYESTGEWHGPGQIGGSGSTYSAPSVAIEQATGQRILLAEGPGNTMYSYTGYESLGGEWHGPGQIGGSGSTYSAPSVAIEQTHGERYLAAIGANTSLVTYTGYESTAEWHGPGQIGTGAD